MAYHACKDELPEVDQNLFQRMSELIIWQTVVGGLHGKFFSFGDDCVQKWKPYFLFI